MNERRSYNNQGGYIALTAHSFTSSTYGNDNSGARDRRHYNDSDGNGGGRFGRRSNRPTGRYNDRRTDRPLRNREGSYSREQTDNFEEFEKEASNPKQLDVKSE